MIAYRKSAAGSGSFVSGAHALSSKMESYPTMNDGMKSGPTTAPRGGVYAGLIRESCLRC
jgi:hypothetical protein